MQHAASHTTAVQPSSHNQRHVLIGKRRNEGRNELINLKLTVVIPRQHGNFDSLA